MIFIGLADKTEQFLETARHPFLLIADDTEVFQHAFPKVKVFDPNIHSFNPLKNIEIKGARDFAAAIYTASPEGQNTLTVRNGKRALTRAVLNTTRLDKLKADDEAQAIIDDILLSPVVKKVLCGPPNFVFKGSVIARINRAELGDFDAFILAALLMRQHKGQVIVLDGGFYLKDFHVSLIRQKRLVCGVNFLGELSPLLQKAVLTIKDKRGAGCLWEDAVTLAKYACIPPDTVGYTDFINTLIANPEIS